MEYIYTFVGGIPDFKWLSKKEFGKQFGLPQALGYLGQIRSSLSGEARDHRRPGSFYTGLRNAFAEIDGLGKLYKGSYGKRDTAANAIAFGNEYLGRVNQRYRNIFGILFDMYRHGLTHSHLIRTARYKKSGVTHFVYWEMTEDRNGHLSLRTHGVRTWLVISVPQLVDDTIAAIELFAHDLKIAGAKSRLFSRFKKGYEGTCTTLREPLPPSPKKATPAKPKKKLPKLRLSDYSKDGLDWIRKNS